MICFFVSDLHGRTHRYKKLFSLIRKEKPCAVFFGGDLLPSMAYLKISAQENISDFISDFLIPELQLLKKEMGNSYPVMFTILGNDDPRSEEEHLVEADKLELLAYIHFRKAQFMGYNVYGYSYVPPTPFLLKDWERYDVSRYADPGCIHPMDGRFTVIPEDDLEFSSIKKDLASITAGAINNEKSIFLFHSPPYKTNLDRAGLDGKTVDHVPLDVHVGSIAIMQFIEEFQPAVTLHGHIHESSRITGAWKQQFNKTWSYSAAYDTEELAVVIFDPDDPSQASRLII